MYDPHADAAEVRHEYGLKLASKPGSGYDAIVLAVSHDDFRNLDWTSLRKPNAVVYDVKGFLDPALVTARL